MEIARNLQLAWRNDSFYMQTASRKMVDIFEAGIVGCMVGRITGVISPRDGAIYSAANRVFNIFIKSMENRFAKEFFMSGCDEDEKLEKVLRLIVRLVLADYLSKGFCSLVKAKSIRTFNFNMAGLQFVGVSLAIQVVIRVAFNKLFHSSHPRTAF